MAHIGCISSISSALAHIGCIGSISSALARPYSVLRATTGSFFAALLAGRRPEIRVRPMLSATRITASRGSRNAIFGIPERLSTMVLAITVTA